MAKDRVYSWRVDGQTLSSLEVEARREGTSVAELLDRMTTEWLRARRSATTWKTPKRFERATRRGAQSDRLRAETPIERREPERSSARACKQSVLANVLVDTGALLALLDEDDRWHAPCVEAFDTWAFPLLTTSAVLTELFHLVGDHRRDVANAWKLVRSGQFVLRASTTRISPSSRRSWRNTRTVQWTSPTRRSCSRHVASRWRPSPSITPTSNVSNRRAAPLSHRSESDMN